jgi:Lar family restriction alleviation protein
MRNVAEKIYEELNNRGAELGTAAIGIIDKVLESERVGAVAQPNAQSVLSDVGELLPCPFCGSKAELKETDLGGYILWCTNYDCYVHGMHSHNKDEVIAAWNKRANVR